MKKKFWLAVAIFYFNNAYCYYCHRKQKKKKSKEVEALKGTHRLSFVFGHSHLSEGIQDNGKKGWKAVPSMGIDYDYWLSNRLCNRITD